MQTQMPPSASPVTQQWVYDYVRHENARKINHYTLYTATPSAPPVALATARAGLRERWGGREGGRKGGRERESARYVCPPYKGSRRRKIKRRLPCRPRYRTCLSFVCSQIHSDKRLFPPLSPQTPLPHCPPASRCVSLSMVYRRHTHTTRQRLCTLKHCDLKTGKNKKQEKNKQGPPPKDCHAGKDEAQCQVYA